MFSRVVYLIYNGAHYDVMVKRENNGSETGIFEINDSKTRKDVISYANDIILLKTSLDAKKLIMCKDCQAIFDNISEVFEHITVDDHQCYLTIDKTNF
jgi:hypothetical protein